MFKDTDEELARLASELLKAEEEEEYDEEEYDEKDYEAYEDESYDEEAYDEDYEEYDSGEELPAYAYEIPASGRIRWCIRIIPTAIRLIIPTTVTKIWMPSVKMCTMPKPVWPALPL